ncbi:MAG: hypothetical protein BWX44_00594 [Spirochaetes bacterium ADurb.Bin001]|nr:MAG: hypothetical protein BWX44_00594 [Spirochaetes bacterium ADurb.Bin001]
MSPAGVPDGEAFARRPFPFTRSVGGAVVVEQIIATINGRSEALHSDTPLSVILSRPVGDHVLMHAAVIGRRFSVAHFVATVRMDFASCQIGHDDPGMVTGCADADTERRKAEVINEDDRVVPIEAVGVQSAWTNEKLVHVGIIVFNSNGRRVGLAALEQLSARLL